MAEYIERETMIQAIREYSGFFQDSPSTNHMILKMEAEDVARDLEAADVAPVVHGLWLPEHHKDKVSQTEYHSYIWYHCSECGRRLIGYRDPREAPYCHCGAKMDLRGENDDGSEKA